jgi:pimeloyl-ACP methyl ester carboxylesterase
MISNYWQKYFSKQDIDWCLSNVREEKIHSTKVKIHLDIYEANKPKAYLIFGHGGGGYSRIFIPLARELQKHNITVIFPNYIGQGFSEGDRSDLDIPEFVQNMTDTITWSFKTYGGNIPLFVSGGSQGSSVAYMAGSVDNRVKSLILHNFYDYADKSDILALTRFAFLSKNKLTTKISAWFSKTAGTLFPNLKISYQILAKFNNMVDEPEFYQLWKNDPVPIQKINLAYFAHSINTEPKIKIEDNKIPTLVINPIKDKMVDPAITKRNYDRLNCKKEYVEIPFGHWSTNPEFYKLWCKKLQRCI